MKQLKKRIAKLLSLTLLMTSLPTQMFAQSITLGEQSTEMSITQTTTPAALEIQTKKFYGLDYDVEFCIAEKGEDTFNGIFQITNTGDRVLEDWEIQFEFDHPITDIQNGIITDYGDQVYTISSTESRTHINVNETIDIPFTAEYGEIIIAPSYYTLTEKVDYEHCPESEVEYALWKQKTILKCERNNQILKENKVNTFIGDSLSGEIRNNSVRFEYEANGGYNIYTTGGNPDNPRDDNARLLYRGTSYTTVRIDGENYTFTPETATRYENKVIRTKRYGDLIVSQHISIIPNQYTGRDDVVELFYTVENTTDKPHDVGVRIMFDTMLGNNDYAPFRLPGIGDVTTEVDLRGDDIPEFWQAFDNLANPSVIAQGTLKVDTESTPDRVRFTNWSTASRNPWDYNRPQGSANGDSGVCLYWNERELVSGETLACKTYYGLSALQQDLRPPLAVALSGATKLEVVENKDGKQEYSPNPFTVTAYIQNIGTGTAENVQAKINLPQGMEVVEGSETINLGAVPVGTKQHQVSWKVKVHPSSVDKIEKYSVTVTADNADEKVLEREISIPVIEMDLLRVQVNKNWLQNYDALKLRIINTSNQLVDTQLLTIKYYYDYLVHEELVGTCNNVLVNNNWVSDGSSKVLITSDKTDFDDSASGVVNVDLENLEIVLQPNEQIELEIGLRRSNNWAIEHMKNYSSSPSKVVGNDESYTDWNTILVERTSDNRILWGTTPGVDRTYTVLGRKFNSDWLEDVYPEDVKLGNLVISEDGNGITLEGIIDDSKTVQPFSVVTNAFRAIQEGQIILLPQERYVQQWEILHISYEPQAKPYQIITLDADKLINKNILRIVLRDIDTNEVIIFEDAIEDTLLENSIGNAKIPNGKYIEQIEEMCNWENKLAKIVNNHDMSAWLQQMAQQLFGMKYHDTLYPQMNAKSVGIDEREKYGIPEWVPEDIFYTPNYCVLTVNGTLRDTDPPTNEHIYNSLGNQGAFYQNYAIRSFKGQPVYRVHLITWRMRFDKVANGVWTENEELPICVEVTSNQAFEYCAHPDFGLRKKKAGWIVSEPYKIEDITLALAPDPTEGMYIYRYKTDFTQSGRLELNPSKVVKTAISIHPKGKEVIEFAEKGWDTITGGWKEWFFDIINEQTTIDYNEIGYPRDNSEGSAKLLAQKSKEGIALTQPRDKFSLMAEVHLDRTNQDSYKEIPKRKAFYSYSFYIKGYGSNNVVDNVKVAPASNDDRTISFMTPHDAGCKRCTYTSLDEEFENNNN